MAHLLDEKKALDLVLTFLQDKPAPTDADISEAVGFVGKAAPHLDLQKLKKFVEATVNVHMGSFGVLDDATDHLVWLPERRGSIKWRFWDRYAWYLRHAVEGMAPQTVDAIEDVTSRILERLEDPQRAAPWDRRGMVMGDVQAGKTSNYIGLICRAADAGYKVIVVLAGMHNNLRSQTQLRVDLGFLGFDTSKNLAFTANNKRVGVGSLPQKEFSNAVAHALTSSKPDGDFNTPAAQNAAVNPKGTDPVILVVKKNKSVLSNLIKYLQGYADPNPNGDDQQQLDVPILVIDDEADNASVNTGPTPEPGQDWQETDVKTINGLIRQLLMRFRRRAYVGYTATPYANIFIPPDASTKTHGPDLFPAAFILTLPTPSDHVGPVEVFGLDEDRPTGTAAREGLPMLRTIESLEAESFVPAKHKREHVPGELPPSLEKAIRSFILSCALRACRGQGKKHQSMLVHVTRYIWVQQKVGELIKKRLTDIVSALKSEGKTHNEEIAALKEIWDTDYEPTTATVIERWNDPRIVTNTWQQIRPLISDVAPKINVDLINGEAADIQNYKAAEEAGIGYYVIAVGGDKLSRGLTLEGLTVSYFLRATKMYDTLMQMGRWFGYRPGYADACRLYTTADLAEWYQHIALVNLELRRDFDYMTSIGARPLDFGLRVRQHPGGMIVTSAGKMRTGEELEVSFADSLAETVVFHRDPAINKANQNVVAQLVERLIARSLPDTQRPSYFLWSDVPSSDVVDFLKGFTSHPESRRSRTDLLSEFIELQNAVNELSNWTVALINNPTSKEEYALGPLKGGCTERQDTNQHNSKATPYTLTKQHLISPPDELVDLDEQQQAVALDVTRTLWEKSTKKNKSDEPPGRPSGKGARAARPATRGLLLIYQLVPKPDFRRNPGYPISAFAISFPASEEAQTVSYKVNYVYLEEEFGGAA